MELEQEIEGIKLIPKLDTLQLLKIDDATYFSPKYSNYVSNSRLGLINPEQGGSPEKYFEGFPSLYSDSLIFGSCCHQQLLQPEYFEMCDIVNRPTAKCGFIADILYKNGYIPTDDEIIDAATKVNYYHGDLNSTQMKALKEKIFPYFKARTEFENSYQDTKELMFLDEKSRDKFYRCMSNLNGNRNIQDLLHPIGLMEPVITENEWTILLDMEVHYQDYDPFVVKLKSKLDNFTIDKDTNTITVNDLKTHGRSIDLFADSVDHWHYFRELAMYSTLLVLIAQEKYGMTNPNVKGNFLVVSTIPPYDTSVYRMTKELYHKGITEFHKLLKMVAYYMHGQSNM